MQSTPSMPAGLKSYLLVCACYWAFTLSDGALRMLVLLHLHEQGQTAWGLTLALLPYEAAGVATNLLGGYLGARFGLKLTLITGLLLQALACGLLSVDGGALTIGYVMMTQVFSGIAKDLAKTSAKSYVRALTPGDVRPGLFQLVATLTGSKNTMKGLGFFFGGALLAWVGFRHTNVGLAIMLATTALLAVVTLPAISGRKGARIGSVVSADAKLRWLSVARMFLFGSRDVWFAVALPLYLVSQDWSQPAVGAALAGWILIYGMVQALAPKITRVSTPAEGARTIFKWTTALALPLAATAMMVTSAHWPNVGLWVGLSAYGAMFAVSSSLHSWLVVAMHEDHHVAERVGFYYSANAAGRVMGLTGSGWLYGLAPSPVEGLVYCVSAAVCATLIAAICTLRLRAVIVDLK